MTSSTATDIPYAGRSLTFEERIDRLERRERRRFILILSLLFACAVQNFAIGYFTWTYLLKPMMRH